MVVAVDDDAVALTDRRYKLRCLGGLTLPLPVVVGVAFGDVLW